MQAITATAAAIMGTLLMTGAVAGQEPTREPAVATTVICISVEAASEPEGGWSEQKLARALKAGEASIIDPHRSEGLVVVLLADSLGLPEGDLLFALDMQGLMPGQRSEASDSDAPAGTVIAMDPSPGTELSPGSSVDYVVSTGPDAGAGSSEGAGPVPVVVPEGAGLPEAEFLILLEAADLVPGQRSEASDESAPAGTVIAMDPAPGTEVAPGTSIYYAVSTGPGSAPGPSEPASPELSATSPWPAFLDRATAFGDALATLTVLYDAAVDQDDEGVAAAATELRQLARDTLIWLDENPPEPCFTESWQAFQTAAEHLEIAMDAVLTSGFLSAADEYSAMGKATSGMLAPLQDAIEACAAPGG